MAVLRRGDTGVAVADIRARLVRLRLLDPDSESSLDDAEYDDDVERAVRTFQQQRGISVDGICGPQTMRHLEEARWGLGDRVLAFTPGHLIRGDDVFDLQQRLTRMGFDCGRPDGIFGPLTDSALREFQRNVGMEPDGTCGFTTYWALERLTRTVGDGDAVAIRERQAMDAMRSGVAGKVIALDPGGADADQRYALAEAAIVADVCARIEGRLAALGTQVIYTRTPTPELVNEAERASHANAANADLLLSLHVERVELPGANGFSTFYFGAPLGGPHSAGARVVAEHIQEQVCTRTDLTDCRSHPRTWDLLRLTTMPTVWVEMGYLSHPGDAARLSDPRFRDTLSEAIAIAVTTFFAPAP
ncbi:MAG: N-acetylmuramoyl-L-alanine amidase [Candidatus Nanopelagicales bacterium]|jgi:N-acetylmuramoyl-L-alanine amidase